MKPDAPPPEFGAFLPGPRLRIARALSGGPLAGLSFAAKDLIDVAGTVTGCGNPDWRRTHAPAAHNAPVIDILLDAGARLAGKTVTDELAFSLEGANAHDGTPVNPRCPGRLPGGSSSGSAVAVAARLVDFALGTDTGGSVRVPASFCGIFGFRPSHGRVPLAGVMPFAPSYDTVGWFARDGGQLARVGAVLLGGAATPALRTLLVARDAFALCDPAAAARLRAAALRLGAVGEIELFGGAGEHWRECYRVLQGGEIWSNLGPWIAATRPHLGAVFAPRFADAARIAPGRIAECVAVRRDVATGLARLLDDGVGLVLPTAPCIAPRTDAPAAEIAAFYARTLTLTCVAGHAGLPQVSLPLARLAGCPLGLSVIAAAGSDAALLALAEGLGPLGEA